MIYTPEQFSVSDRQLLFGLMREYPFASLVCCSSDDPLVAHIPVLVDETRNVIQAHLARANVLWRRFTKQRELLFIFHGPHHYVSPGWYDEHPSVPTWNYAVVHAHAIPTIIEDRASVESMLRKLVEVHESQQRTPWQMELPDDYLRSMIDGIVAFEARITRVHGKFKLSQNRSSADRSNVIAGLRQESDADAARLARLMEQLGGG